MDGALLIDTNVYKMISKNQEEAVKVFEVNLDHGLAILKRTDPASRLYYATTKFGFCEYLGLKLPKAGPSEDLWSELDEPQRPEDLTRELVDDYVRMFREDLRQTFEPVVTTELLNKYIDEERKYQSEAFKSSDLYRLFATYADLPREAVVNDLLDLTVVDSLHQSTHYPASVRDILELDFRISAYVELFMEFRNFALFRSAKQAWLNRVVTEAEKQLPKEVATELDEAMRSIKTGGDRFDLELVTLFLFGHAPFGEKKRNPAMIYTKDRPEQFLARAVVLYAIVSETARDLAARYPDDDVYVPMPRPDSAVFFLNDEFDIGRAVTGTEFIAHYAAVATSGSESS